MTAPSEESLLASIESGTELTEDLIKKIYGYELCRAGFADQAIAALEAAGYSKARQYYEAWVSEYETKRDAGLKEVAQWYRLELERRRENKQEGCGEQRKQKQTKQTMQTGQASRKWMDGLF